MLANVNIISLVPSRFSPFQEFKKDQDQSEQMATSSDTLEFLDLSFLALLLE